jgi:cytochrome b subunit of formate dehydrogenase
VADKATSKASKVQRIKRLRRALHWRWVFFGVLVMVAGHVLAYWLLGETIVALVEEDPVLAFAAAAGVPLFIYFLGGLIVGRLSPGETIQEPAVAGVIGLLLVSGLQLLAGMINLFGLLIGAPFSFAMAYLGGWIGELWQASADRKRPRR